MKRYLAGLLVVAIFLIAVSPSWADLQRWTMKSIVVMKAATTNATAAAAPGVVGPKSFYGQVVGTGAVTQTQAIYGDIDADAANGILLCTITLSGTTSAQDACPVVTANFSYFYVITTNTTGTGATGVVYAMY